MDPNHFDILQIKAMCPGCKSETLFVSEKKSPILIKCEGCKKVLVIQDGLLYTVSEEFLKREIFPRFKMSGCGKVLSFLSQDEAKPPVMEKDVEQIKTLLEDDLDVLDFIRRAP